MDFRRHFLRCVKKIGKSKHYLSRKKVEGVYDSEWKMVVPKNNLNIKNGCFIDADV